MKLYLQRKAFIIACRLLKFAGLYPLMLGVEEEGIGCGLAIFGLPKYSDRITGLISPDPFDMLDKSTVN
jgi:hypothetical protein